MKVNYYQVDHKVKSLLKAKGVELLTSVEAYNKHAWSHKYFKKKPKEGYFIWIKKQIGSPLTSCVSIFNAKVSQQMENLIIVEPKLKVTLNATCNSLRANLCARHNAIGNVVLKKGAEVKVNHIHAWNTSDSVDVNYSFLLEENAKLAYNYKNINPPKQLKMNTIATLSDGASMDFSAIVDGEDIEVNLQDAILLKGKNSNAVVRLRFVGRDKARIAARSSIIAEGASQGHLDCQGLLLSKTAEIKLIPELNNKNQDAQITHEASIGRISEEVLEYLESRGLTEKQAIDLVVKGFLNGSLPK